VANETNNFRPLKWLMKQIISGPWPEIANETNNFRPLFNKILSDPDDSENFCKTPIY